MKMQFLYKHGLDSNRKMQIKIQLLETVAA